MSAIARKPDWAAALDTFLQASRQRKFAYGSWDCCLFAAAAIHAMTGCDMAAPYRRCYGSRRASVRLVGSVASVAAKVFGAHGLSEVPPAMAQRGDAVLVHQSGRDALGVMAMDGCNALVLGLKGICSVPAIPNVIRAWRV